MGGLTPRKMCIRDSGNARLCDGFLTGHEIECPLHQGRFDVRDGRALCSPLRDNLATCLLYTSRHPPHPDCLWAAQATVTRKPVPTAPPTTAPSPKAC